ncbi:STAS domain-containing protein [Polyangium aurulentum]|uniref:STAS domain-containing protein n=1 Tax=Polyangium aurulentum TaxID=2567896 RepID=UPI00146E9B4B|nr:STAS domain-containing protein [Polyangium aurulentum]UQA56838.1 STAS domain-containing protein [Polyangium aurulentum]
MHQALFEHCPEILVVANPDGVIIGANHEAERALGARCASGASLLDAVHPDDLPGFSLQWLRLAGGGAPSRAVSRIQVSDHGYRPFSWSARRLPESPAVHAVLIPASEEDLPPAPAKPEPSRPQVHTERLLRAILDTLDIAVSAIDERGVFTFHEGKVLAKVDKAFASNVGLNIFELYASTPVVVDNVRRALEGQQVNYTVDAHDAVWENWFAPIRDEQGQVTGAVAVSIDKTESRRAMQELEARLAIIERQQEVIRNLETPVIQLWEHVITLPMVGIVDSRRAARVMDDLLAAVVRTAARYAILDLTGVDTVDTATALHLIGLVRAIRLLGAEGIITGIRPTVAQTIVTLGLDLSSIITCGTLRDGLKLCIKRLNGAARA